MKIKSIILVLVIVLLLSQVGYSSTKRYLTIIDGNKYLDIPENDRLIFIAGLFDMWNYMYQKEQPDNYEIIYMEIENMNTSQIKKIFEKFLEDHPEHLHWATATLFDVAIHDSILGGFDEL